MIKSFLYCVLGVLLLSFSVKPKGFTIEVNLAGAPDGKKVYLRNAERKVIDSTTIKNCTFKFRGVVKHPQLYSMAIVDEKQRNPNFHPVIPVFVENSKIKISARLDSLSLEANFKGGQYKYSQVKVEGSASHETYLKYIAGYDPLNEERKIAFRKYLDYLNYEDTEDVYKGIRLINEVDKAAEKRNNYIKEYILNNPGSFVSLYLANDNISLYSIDEIDEIMSAISPKLLKTKPGKGLMKTAGRARGSAAGAIYTDLPFEDTEGNTVRLSDYVGKGKYVLLEFWASWCVPCRADIPHLKRNYDLYHPEGFELISVSMDGKKEDWLNAVKEEKMKWLQISDLNAFDGEVSKIYNFSGIPTCILIDPNGKIVTRNMRGSWMDKRLIEMYGDKFKKD